MERTSYASLKKFLSSIPAKALNFSSRHILSIHLSTQQLFRSRKGYAKDYRGLAEHINLPYDILKTFEKSEDCTMRILDAWEIRPDATLDKLISYLEDMDRHDIIQILIPTLKRNIEKYLEFEMSATNLLETPKEWITFDAYLSYADEDRTVASQFVERLECPRVKLKLFIRGRDKFSGSSILDTHKKFEFIKNRCRHMLIFLTPNFVKSPALEFLASFIDSLSNEQKQRTLIPVIWKSCKVPPMLNGLSKIDFSKDHAKVWEDLMLENLIMALLPKCDITMFLPSES